MLKLSRQYHCTDTSVMLCPLPGNVVEIFVSLYQTLRSENSLSRITLVTNEAVLSDTTSGGGNKR